MGHTQSFLDFCFGLQALRRIVERNTSDLHGALGVRAEVLPHQAASVQRVLTAPEVRHLLADEVGLGKTIQALMVLNALRLQRPGLRATVLVPDPLALQWQDELLGRSHEAAVAGSERFDPEGRNSTRLVWPKKLMGPSDLVAQDIELLIVDEFHSLPKVWQRQVLALAPEVPNLLLLSATPPFQDPERASELLQILEPGWARQTPSEVRLVDHARQREALAAAHLGARASQQEREEAAHAACVYRRVVRSRRSDWPELLPARRHRSTVVEPLQHEEQRQELMWNYFHHLSDLTRVLNLDKLAQRVIRSPASLRQRVTYLRGHGHEREGLLGEVDTLLKTERTDSRLEALIDVLAGIWEREPEARIVVAAGDNLTVDDLHRYLPVVLDQVGPLEDRRSPSFVRLRNQGSAATDYDGGGDDDVRTATDTFTAGLTSVLLAADVGKEGLNLQSARHLVLYSIPWDPLELEQWLGRIDRIGSVALDADSPERAVVVHTIVQRGLVDERVLRVIEATGILRRSIALDRERVAEVRDLIRAAALEGSRADWSEVERSARRLGETIDLSELGSPLLDDLPWTPAWADCLYRREVDQAPAWPELSGLKREADSGVVRREKAMLRWIRAMTVAGIYDSWWSKELAVRALRCHRTDRPKGPPVINKAGYLGSELSDDGYKSSYYICRRSELQQPPRSHVRYADANPQVLHFLSHGSLLHESLIDLWRRRGEGMKTARLHVPKEHPAVGVRGRRVLLGAALFDPASLLSEDSVALVVAGAARGLAPEQAHQLVEDRVLRAWLDADVRLVRSVVPSMLVLVGMVENDGEWRPLTNEVVTALVDAVGPSAKQQCSSSPGVPEGEAKWLVDVVEPLLHQQAVEQMGAAWQPAIERAEDVLVRRRRLVEREREVLDGAGVPICNSAVHQARRHARHRWLGLAVEGLEELQVPTLGQVLVLDLERW